MVLSMVRDARILPFGARYASQYALTMVECQMELNEIDEMQQSADVRQTGTNAEAAMEGGSTERTLESLEATSM